MSILLHELIFTLESPQSIHLVPSWISFDAGLFLLSIPFLMCESILGRAKYIGVCTMYNVQCAMHTLCSVDCV